MIQNSFKPPAAFPFGYLLVYQIFTVEQKRPQEGCLCNGNSDLPELGVLVPKSHFLQPKPCLAVFVVSKGSEFIITEVYKLSLFLTNSL